jgi:hypothetical protein
VLQRKDRRHTPPSMQGPCQQEPQLLVLQIFASSRNCHTFAAKCHTSRDPCNTGHATLTRRLEKRCPMYFRRRMSSLNGGRWSQKAMNTYFSKRLHILRPPRNS